MTIEKPECEESSVGLSSSINVSSLSYEKSSEDLKLGDYEVNPSSGHPYYQFSISDNDFNNETINKIIREIGKFIRRLYDIRHHNKLPEIFIQNIGQIRNYRFCKIINIGCIKFKPNIDEVLVLSSAKIVPNHVYTVTVIPHLLEFLSQELTEDDLIKAKPIIIEDSTLINNDVKTLVSDVKSEAESINNKDNDFQNFDEVIAAVKTLITTPGLNGNLCVDYNVPNSSKHARLELSIESK